jgi:hypothetical protein
VPFDERAKSLLAIAESKGNGQLQGQVDFYSRIHPGARPKQPITAAL